MPPTTSRSPVVGWLRSEPRLRFRLQDVFKPLWRLIFAGREASLPPPGVAWFNPVKGGGGVCMANQVQDLTPEEVSKGVEDGRSLLVDVREPNEVAAEAYPFG